MARQIIEKVKIYTSPLCDGRRYVMLSLHAGGFTGWGECYFPRSHCESMITELASCLCPLKGLNVSEGLASLRSHIGKLPYSVTEATELALIDLHGRITAKSALSILVLNSRRPIPDISPLRLYNPDTAYEEACKAPAGAKIARLRMSGDPETDRALISSLRGISERGKLFIIADCAGCYSDALDFSIEKLGIRLIMFGTAGLDACEDPADLTPSDFFHLREFIAPMPIIASSLCRPARRLLKGFVPEMADYLSLHIGQTASVFDAVELAEKQRSCGGRLIIVGGAEGLSRKQWRQLAIGMGAEWTESTEFISPFAGAVGPAPLGEVDGMTCLTGSPDGFGIEINERILASLSEQMAEL